MAILSPALRLSRCGSLWGGPLDPVPAHREQGLGVHGRVDVVDRVRIVFGESFRDAIGEQHLIAARAQQVVQAREHRQRHRALVGVALVDSADDQLADELRRAGRACGSADRSPVETGRTTHQTIAVHIEDSRIEPMMSVGWWAPA